jgi:hypothetical protein
MHYRGVMRRLELAAYGVDATAAMERAWCGATAAPVAPARHREEAHHAREVARGAVLRGAHGDPPLGAVPSERRGHGARAPAWRHALHAGPRHGQCGAPADALCEPRQRHGGA